MILHKLRTRLYETTRTHDVMKKVKDGSFLCGDRGRRAGMHGVRWSSSFAERCWAGHTLITCTGSDFYHTACTSPFFTNHASCSAGHIYEACSLHASLCRRLLFSGCFTEVTLVSSQGGEDAAIGKEQKQQLDGAAKRRETSCCWVCRREATSSPL